MLSGFSNQNGGCASCGKEVKMVRDKSFYKEFFAVMLTLVLQQVITLSVNLADNIMLGAYSETALSGVAAVNQIQFVYQQMMTAVGEGVVILGTQYYGKGKLAPIRTIASIAMHTGLLIMAGLFLLASFFPSRLLSVFTTDEAIIAEGMAYLRIIRFTYLFFAMTQILLATLRSVGTVRIALGLSIWSFIVNCLINYTLIYGHFGAPRMGAAGAAVGTLTARVTEFLILVFYIVRKEKTLRLTPRMYLRTDPVLRKDYLKVMAPVFLVGSLWGLNTAAQNAILGHMTARAIAANSVASTLFLLVKSMAVGTSSAASIFIGRTVGEGEEKKLGLYSRTLQVLFVLVGLCSGVILFVIRIPVLSLYQLEPATREMADTFLRILCVVIVTMSYQMPVNTGIVRGGGDSRFVMKLDLVSIWGIVIPLSFLMAFVVKASPVVVVCCLNADQVFKCVPAFLKVNYGHWAKKLTRESGV